MYNYETIHKIKLSKYTARVLIVMGVVLLASIAMNIYAITKVNGVQDQISEINQEVSDSKEANEQVLSMLQEVRDNQKKQNEALQIVMKRKAEEKQQKQNIIILKSNGISEYMDLGSNINISVEDMDKIINYYESKVKGGSRFKGKGYVFVQAAKETGLNPVYLYAHAAVESAFGNSYLARTRSNFYGINAWDTNPDRASTMGDSVDEGIINGAYWIKDNYYDRGYTTLNSMKEYYASDPSWADSITSIANEGLRNMDV